MRTFPRRTNAALHTDTVVAVACDSVDPAQLFRMFNHHIGKRIYHRDHTNGGFTRGVGGVRHRILLAFAVDIRR